MAPTKRVIRINLFVQLLLLPLSALASPWVGGYITMEQKTFGANPKFEFSLFLFLDYFNTPLVLDYELRNNPQKVLVGQKKDDKLIEYLDLNFKSTTDVRFANPICAQSRSLGIKVYKFSVEKIMDRNSFLDLEGYYLAWERCCRNTLLNNISQADQSGIVLYSEFPPLVKNTLDFDNSLPNMTDFLGDYICNNVEKRFQFRFIDKDIDKIKYSFARPKKGHNKPINNNALTQTGPYDEVNWAVGYGANNMINGPIPLKIDENTGVINVKSNINGLFTFTISAEDFRNGKRLGLVEMTIQIAVSNCNFPTTQNNTITFSDGTTSPKTTCGTTLFDLRSTLNSGFIFQWKKDDVNIFNQNFTNLTTIEPGQYTLATVSLSNCTNESISNSLTIKKEDESLKIFSTSAIVCDTQNVVLSNSENTIVKWYQNDTFIADNTQIIIGDSATYSIKSLTSTCPNAADSIKIEKFAFSISDYSILPTELNLCISKSETIETVFDTIYEYQWFSNNGILSGKTNSTLQVTEPGTYYLKLSSNDNICTKNLRPLTFLKPGNCINIPQSYLPNVFSPNGDGINDILTFEFAKFDKTTRILLYDRWGTELYQNSLDKFAWDGSIKGGKQADPGIYIVVFENPTLKLKHPVSLVR